MAIKRINFKECIDSSVVDIKNLGTLPICHTTNWGNFDKIQGSGIAPAACDIYPPEMLTYFFYGKASYLIKGTNLPVIGDEPPITLIYDMNDIEHKMHRALPFDSGGYERYKIRQGFKKEDFTYPEPTPEVIKKMIKVLYSTNPDYLKIKMSTFDTTLRNLCRPLMELARLYDITKAGRTLEYGRQAFTFEIQYKDVTIPFKPKIVVLPISYIDDDAFRLDFAEMFQENGITLDYYNCDDTLLEGSDSYTNMKKKVEELIKQYCPELHEN